MTTQSYWYSEWRSWVVTDHDSEGNQIGEARYYPNKSRMKAGEASLSELDRKSAS